LKAANTDASDSFGQAVALSGDTLVVGAKHEDSCSTSVVNGASGYGTNNGCGNSGAVYVFTRSGSSWTPQAYLKAANAGSSDYFGWSLALSGDTIVVGAYGEDSCVSDSGSSGQVRLVGGQAPNEGRVEVYYGSYWGTVCDDGWGQEDAHAACVQAGYSGGAVANGYNGLAYFGQGSGPIYFDDVACSVGSTSLTSCSRYGGSSSFGSHN
jgi:hypothetical protein